MNKKLDKNGKHNISRYVSDRVREVASISVAKKNTGKLAMKKEDTINGIDDDWGKMI